MPQPNLKKLTVFNLPLTSPNGDRFNRREIGAVLDRYLKNAPPPKPMFSNCRSGAIEEKAAKGNCGAHGGSASCGVCRRELQLVSMALIPELLDQASGDLWMVTLVRKEWRRDFNRLGSWSLRNAKRYVYVALRQLPNVRAFGAFDISLEIDSRGDKRTWAPHAHLVVSGATSDDIRAAFPRQTATTSLRRPLLIKAIDDVVGAVAYVSKLAGVSRTRFNLSERKADGQKKRGSRKLPLTKNQREILEQSWREHRQADHLIMIGMKFPRWVRVQSEPDRQC